MHIFDILRQSLQKQLCIVFNENHVAGIGHPPADGKDRLCRTLRRRQAVSFTQCMVSHSLKLGVNVLQNREEKHFLGFVEFIERALRNADRLRQLIYGGFLHPQRDSTAPRFLQQRLAELLGLVIGKSQAHAPLNMTISVYLVILYHASFWFARGVEKNILILTKNYFPLTHCFMKALLFLWQRTAPPSELKLHPLTRFLSKFESFAKTSRRNTACFLLLIRLKMRWRNCTKSLIWWKRKCLAFPQTESASFRCR